VKHPVSVTALLVALFIAAQVIGLVLLALDIKAISETDGERVVEHQQVVFGERPDTEGLQSFLYLSVGIAIGTALVLLLIRFQAYSIWKAWFLFAVWFSMTMALGVIMPAAAALIICLIIAVWKVYWPNPLVHNGAEIFMYAGIAVLIVPLFNLFWIIMLLLAVSVYDVIAVWYSKHMVTMAQAQTKSNVFAGLYVPKNSKSKPAEAVTRTQAGPTQAIPASKGSAAILGGGDIAFPLIFSGVVMDWLIISGSSMRGALFETLIITATTTLALVGLFYYAKKDKFYPAMPFLTAGCLLGLAIVAL
jgi:presenilin-like A22 family membrane protease